jgi:hypothetical protein
MGVVRIVVKVTRKARLPEIEVFAGLELSCDDVASWGELETAASGEDEVYSAEFAGPSVPRPNCRWMVFVRAPHNSPFVVEVIGSKGEHVGTRETVGTRNFSYLTGTIALSGG